MSRFEYKSHVKELVIPPQEFVKGKAVICLISTFEGVRDTAAIHLPNGIRRRLIRAFARAQPGNSLLVTRDNRIGEIDNLAGYSIHEIAGDDPRAGVTNASNLHNDNG